MDSGGASRALEFWEYISDIIIRLDHTGPTSPAEGYMLRTIEVVKARYQHHAWGPHQLKLYEPYDITPEEAELDENGDQGEQYSDQLRRAHPFREQGGIFIYPSIHYLLSTYKRSDPTLGLNSVPPKILTLELYWRADFRKDAAQLSSAYAEAMRAISGSCISSIGFFRPHNECGLIVSLPQRRRRNGGVDK